MQLHQRPVARSENLFLRYFAINQKGIKVDFFCDSSELKQGKKIFGIKTISPEELEKFDKKTNIFISNNYVTVVNNLLKEKNFSNI